MFATSPYRSPTGPNLSGMYRQVGVASAVDAASPHRLVTLLYDGLLESLAEARGAIAVRDVEAKGRAIGRAVRILEEGLRGGLNPEGGGDLARNLDDLYRYVSQCLTVANLRSDPAALAECYGLIEPLRDAWVAIGAVEASATPKSQVRA